MGASERHAEGDQGRPPDLSRLENFVDHLVGRAPIIFFAIDSEGTITASRGAGLAALGVNDGDLVGVSVWDLYADRPDLLDNVLRALDGEVMSNRVTVGDAVHDSEIVPISHDGEIIGIVGVSIDVSERAALEAEVFRLGTSDQLTGLENRQTFLRSIESRAPERSADRRCVVVLDLDDFDRVNTVRGRGPGDEILRAVATRLREALRATDAAARLGGDQFAVCFDAGRDSAETVVRRLLTDIARPIPTGLGSVAITASAGVIGPGLRGATGEAALEKAMLAMNRAKQGDGNNLVTFEEKFLVEVREALRLRAELDTAIAENQFVVHYQPLWNLENSTIASWEALVRWQHPTRGLLAPGEFIPLAETTGQIGAIDALVLERACRQIARWRQSGRLGCNQATIAVNVSALDLERSNTVQLIADTLAEVGLDPTALIVEITETAAMANLEATAAAIDGLVSLGVRVALDDFGTGYSSLAHLQKLSVDILKIDRSFVADGSDHASTSLARTIVGLGHLLGLEVVAEGIETAEQLREMRAIGCHVAQGFYLSRPLDVDQCEALIDADTPENVSTEESISGH